MVLQAFYIMLDDIHVSLARIKNLLMYKRRILMNLDIKCMLGTVMFIRNVSIEEDSLTCVF